MKGGERIFSSTLILLENAYLIQTQKQRKCINIDYYKDMHVYNPSSSSFKQRLAATQSWLLGIQQKGDTGQGSLSFLRLVRIIITNMSDPSP